MFAILASYLQVSLICRLNLELAYLNLALVCSLCKFLNRNIIVKVEKVMK